MLMQSGAGFVGGSCWLRRSSTYRKGGTWRGEGGITFFKSVMVTYLLSWGHKELFALRQLQNLNIFFLSFCHVLSAGFFFLAKVMVNLVENGVAALETLDSLHNSGNALPWG